MKASNRTVQKLAMGLAAVWLLAACTAAVQPERDPDENGPDIPFEGPAKEEPDPDQTLVPRSGVVDLQNLTPASDEGNGNVVQPAPGVADPSVRLVQLASQDLAAVSGVDVSEVDLLIVEAVDWPDSSLGCPKEGEMYLQVITPGYRIVLGLDGKVFNYHSDRGTRFVNCPDD